jgi:hypothetical protein
VPTVNAVCVVLTSSRIANTEVFGELRITMAVATSKGQVRLEHLRRRVVLAEDVVAAVAVRARGGLRVPVALCGRVDTLGKGLCLLLVTMLAVDRRNCATPFAREAAAGAIWRMALGAVEVFVS